MAILNLNHTGKRLPDGAVYIGRAMPRYGLAGSILANPYRVGKGVTREEAIRLYETHLRTLLQHSPEARAELARCRGKDVACWCAPSRCHGEVVERLSNHLYAFLEVGDAQA